MSLSSPPYQGGELEREWFNAMANPEHLAKLKEGVLAWNQWREEHTELTPDLREANFFRADLNSADLAGADLAQANLSGAHLVMANLGRARLFWANLVNAHLGGADLTGVNFTGANLTGANLSGADLSGADLSDTQLHNTNLCLADVSRAKFTRSSVGWTSFSDVDLGHARGLGSVVHMAPSSIGLDTILRSGGKIPARFLRGCGYDSLIQRVLIGDNESKYNAFCELLARGGGPLKLQSCFISYSTRDRAFVHRLQTALNERGVDYWYAPEHGRWGEELRPQIDREIHQRDRVVLVCSRASLYESDWVQWEIDHALAEEKKRGKKVIFPIMLDDSLLKWDDPRASHILEVLAGGFQKATRGPAFKAALEKLLAGLQPRDETVMSGGTIMGSKRPTRRATT
jgi:hypothetical protein